MDTVQMVKIVRVEYRMTSAPEYISKPIAVTQYTADDREFCAPRLYGREEYELAAIYARRVALLNECDFELHAELW